MRNLGSLALALVIAGFTLSIASPAEAHGRAHGHHGIRYVYVQYGPAWPHWLRTHRDFTRWYHARYRGLHPRLKWRRLYDLYRHDRHYHHRLKHDRRDRRHRRHKRH